MLDKSKFEQFSYLSSKWDVEQQRQLATSTMHLAQELLTNVQCSGGLRSFAKETRALKMRSEMAGHYKLTTTHWEHHRSWCSYNYTGSCARTRCQPQYSHLAFKANWKGEKAQWVSASWADYKVKKKTKTHFWSVIFSYSFLKILIGGTTLWWFLPYINTNWP